MQSNTTVNPSQNPLTAEILYHENYPYFKKLAKKYVPYGYEPEDMLGEVYILLADLAEKYPHYNSKLQPVVKVSIGRYLIEKSARMKSQMNYTQRSYRQLGKLCRYITDRVKKGEDYLSVVNSIEYKKIGVTKHTLHLLKDVTESSRHSSYETLVQASNVVKDAEEMHGSTLTDESSKVGWWEKRIYATIDDTNVYFNDRKTNEDTDRLIKALRSLDQRSRDIVLKTVGLDIEDNRLVEAETRTAAEVGRTDYNLTKARIGQIRNAALQKMKRVLST